MTSMFQSLAQRLLNKMLGEYVEEFNSESLSIGILSGEVKLKEIALKKDVMKMLNLPLKLNYSRLGSLQMKIPWQSLTSSKIEVVIEGLEVVIAEIPPAKWDCRDTKIIEKRKKQIVSYCEAVAADFAAKAEKKAKEDDGYFSKLVMRIVDNLQVTVKDIHIRYQDQLSNAYSCGVTLEELQLHTVNTKGQPEYIDRTKAQNADEPLRKRLEMWNVGVYWNEKSEQWQEGEYRNKMSSSIARRNQSGPTPHNYIILLSSHAMLLQRQPGKQFVDPQIDLAINLAALKIEMSNNQLQQVIGLGQRLQRYHQKVKDLNTKQLTSQQLRQHHSEFMELFPKYYKGWGTELTPEEMARLESILQNVEVEAFTPSIKQWLQQQEKTKRIQQKKDSNKGWFSWGKPKQLTEDQMNQIQQFLDDNFGREVKVVARPKDYHYVRVGFKLEQLEVVIANTMAIIKEGISVQLSQLGVGLGVREGGMHVELVLDSISVDMFTQAGVDAPQREKVMSKLQSTTNSHLAKEYLKMTVDTSPLDKPHIKTDIKLVTSELLVVFNPKIITIATSFADFKLSKSNKEAAIQMYGQYKEKATTAVAQTIDKPSKSGVAVDVVLSSLNILVPFRPGQKNSDCWGVNLGRIRMISDQETLMKEVSQDEPLDVFNLALTDFSFRYYKGLRQFEAVLTGKQPYDSVRTSVVDNWDLSVGISVYSSCTETRAKLGLQVQMGALGLNLCQETYAGLMTIGEAFDQGAEVVSYRMTTRIEQKEEITGRASKIGVVHIRDGLTQLWRKYIAVMSDNYIYLYNEKKDRNYAAYYYIKNAATHQIHQENEKERPYQLSISNKLNSVTFGFDRKESIPDWLKKIQALADKEAELDIAGALLQFSLDPSIKQKTNEVAKPQANPDALNVVVSASAESISVNVFTTKSSEESVIHLSFEGLDCQVSLHECKKRIGLSLGSLKLADNLVAYQKKELSYFLLTESSDSLIEIGIEQMAKDHPKYANCDSDIRVHFGKLVCNYKCETVRALMQMFVPPPKDEPQADEASIDTDVSSLMDSVMSLGDDVEIFTLKLKVLIDEVAVVLVNEKVRTMMGRVGITGLVLSMGTSQKKTALQGGLKQLYYRDFTDYPKTIYQQQSQYPQGRYLLAAQQGAQGNMLDFDIKMLKKENKDGKAMLIKTLLANLTAYYTQQPVLRVLAYLNTQMLPSLQPPNAPQSPSQKSISKAKQEQLKAPVLSPMDLDVTLQNLSVVIEPDPFEFAENRERMELNIHNIDVKNQAALRPYVKDKDAVVVVEIFKVQLSGMAITVKYIDVSENEHNYKLTNSMDINTQVELIANPPYYRQLYGESFQSGLRVQCSMTPFFIRLNHHDYNFIMRCLNCAITHNDGLDNVLFDLPNQPNPSPSEQPDKPEAGEPLKVLVKMDCISVFITQQNRPIAFLLLDSMEYKMNNSGDEGQMSLVMHNIYGTSIEHKEGTDKLIEKGMFNALGYTQTHQLEDPTHLPTLIKIFDNRNRADISREGHFLQFEMNNTPRQTVMKINLGQLKVDADIKLLLTLSNLALADAAYVQAPQPVIAPRSTIQSVSEPPSPMLMKEESLRSKSSISAIDEEPPKKSTIVVESERLLACVSDGKKERFVVLELRADFSMINYGERSVAYIQDYLLNSTSHRLSNSEMRADLKDFSLYFSRFKQGAEYGKRVLLRPMGLNFELFKYYQRQAQHLVLATDIDVVTDRMELSASIKDTLNLNVIFQDSMTTLNEVNAQNQSQQKKQEERLSKRQSLQERQLQKKLQQIEKEIKGKIKESMKMRGKIGAVQIDLINDCDSNFMPVFRVLLEPTEPMVHTFLIKNHTNVVPVLSVLFFNPRSSKFEPIIEPFKATIDYLILTTPNGPVTKFLVETHKDDDMGTLRVNLSSQMVATMLQAQKLAEKEREMIQTDTEGGQVQISPFILENMTNQVIGVERKTGQVQLQSLFRGPLRLDDDNDIVFRLKGKVHKYSLDHYGVLKIPGSGYMIHYDVRQLNRVIRWIPQLLLTNCLTKPIFVKRHGKASEVPQKVEPGDMLPLDQIDSMEVSLHGTSYTQLILVSAIKNFRSAISTHKKFVILLNYKQKFNKYAVVEILAPFIVQNCLPKDLSLQFVLKAKTVRTKTIPSQNSHQVCISEDAGQLDYKLLVNGYTWSRKFRFDRGEEGDKEKRLEMTDEQSARTVLNYIFLQDRRTKQYRLTIYCKKIILNEISDKLVVYANRIEDEVEGNHNHYDLLGGQRRQDESFDDKVVLVGDEAGNRIRVCGVKSMVDFATPIPTGGIGSSESRIVMDKKGGQQSIFTMIGVQITAMKMARDSDVYCKKIILRSKSIMVNNTPQDLAVIEESTIRNKFKIAAGQRANLVFGLPYVKGKQYGYTFKSKKFKKSRPIVIPEQGVVYFRMESKKDKLMAEDGHSVQRFFKLYCQPVKSYNFYEVSAIEEEDFPYQIRVESSNLAVRVPMLKRIVKRGELCRFINQNQAGNEFTVDLQIEHPYGKHILNVTVTPDNLNYKERQLLNIEKQGLPGSIPVQMSVTVADKQRVIVIDEVIQRPQKAEVEKSVMVLSLEEMVLSINQNSQFVERPYESLVLTMQRLTLVQNETDRKLEYQVKIGFFQIDQSSPAVLAAPVIMTPDKFQSYTRAQKPESIFNSIIVLDKNFKNNTFVKEISVDFGDLVTAFSADFLTMVIGVSKQFGDVMNFKEETYYLQRHVQSWRKLDVPAQGAKVYINTIQISPFWVTLSAQLNINKLGLENNQFFGTILSAVGVMVSNIDSAPIHIRGFQVKDCIETADAITNKLVAVYKANCMEQLYKVVGSLNIIGNPLGLFRNISTGFKDLAEKPAQGFVNGPAQFGLGIAKGTGSLVAHSVGGVFDSISKVTGTVSTGLATLAFDSEFEEHREKERMKKPKNVLQGFQKGGKAIFYGFTKGLTGLFTQPYKNAKKEGVLGFFKGAAKGVAGVVINPVTGIIDGVSNATEGIKNNALMFEERPNDDRMRYPRVFYSQCFILKVYSLVDSQLLNILLKQKPQQFQDCIFNECYPTQGQRKYLVLLATDAVLIEVEKRDIDWSIPLNALRCQPVPNPANTLMFSNTEGRGLFRSNDFKEQFSDAQTVQRILAEVKELQTQQASSK